MSHFDMIESAFGDVFAKMHKHDMALLDKFVEGKSYDEKKLISMISEFAAKVAPVFVHELLCKLSCPEYDTFNDARNSFDEQFDLFDSVNLEIRLVAESVFSATASPMLRKYYADVPAMFGRSMLIHVRKDITGYMKFFQERLVDSYLNAEKCDKLMSIELSIRLDRYADHVLIY